MKLLQEAKSGTCASEIRDPIAVEVNESRRVARFWVMGAQKWGHSQRMTKQKVLTRFAEPIVNERSTPLGPRQDARTASYMIIQEKDQAKYLNKLIFDGLCLRSHKHFEAVVDLHQDLQTFYPRVTYVVTQHVEGRTSYIM